ncbi:MAG: prepilin-type N-terminal cleavage/methylation domain-containing protein [Planctomycetota bacterium]|jgi:type II secretion system protein J
MKRNGFTFVELLIAVVIGAFVTVTAAAAMRGIVSGRQTCQDLTALSDEMRYACQLIKNDLNNLYRSQDFSDAKFELSYIDGEDGISSQTPTFYTVSRKKARLLQPEGDVYEVQYFVKGDPETGRSVLMRRYCPVVPGVSVGEDIRPGGTLAPLAEHIAALYVRCYNGTEWTDEWNAENGQFPQFVEVALVAAEADGKKTLHRSVSVHIPRLQSGQSDSGTEDSQENYDSYMNSAFSDVQTEGAEE